MLARLYAELAIPTPLGVPLVLRCLMSRLSSVAWCPACPLLFDVPVVRCPRMSWMTFAAWCPVCFLLPDVLYALWLLVYSTPSNVPPRGWKYIIVPDVKTQNPPADLNLDNFTVLKILHRQNIFDSKLNKPPTVHWHKLPSAWGKNGRPPESLHTSFLNFVKFSRKWSHYFIKIFQQSLNYITFCIIIFSQKFRWNLNSAM